MEQQLGELIDRFEAVTGLRVEADQRSRLTQLGQWLVTEAVPAGGIGAAETPRIPQRHLVDSLLFARVWERETPPSSIIDVGTGVGLPGLPLAILWPDSDVLLVDRAGRRTDLARRAVRVLGLSNAEVTTADFRRVKDKAELVTARALAHPEDLRSLLPTLVVPGGIAAVGGSHQERPYYPGYITLDAGEGILDHPVWILIMRSP